MHVADIGDGLYGYPLSEPTRRHRAGSHTWGETVRLRSNRAWTSFVGTAVLVAGLAGLLAGTAIPAGASTPWQVIASPNPDAQGDRFHGVSCLSASDCYAVGGSLIEHFDGTTWTPASFAPPEGSVSVNLEGVACVSDSSCTAVGSWDDDSF